MDSCFLYRPQGRQIPLIENVGDIRIDLGVCNANIAAGITDHLAAQAYAKYLDGHSHLQFAAGYYTQVGVRSVFEVYGGFSDMRGDGFFEDDGGIDGDYIDWHGGNIQTCFLQADYGVKHLGRGNMELGFAFRGGLMRYNVNIYGEQNYSYVGEDGRNHTDKIPYKDENYIGNTPYIEPSIMWRFGWNHFKFDIGASYGVAPGLPILHSGLKLSMGVCFDIDVFGDW